MKAKCIRSDGHKTPETIDDIESYDGPFKLSTNQHLQLVLTPSTFELRLSMGVTQRPEGAWSKWDDGLGFG